MNVHLRSRTLRSLFVATLTFSLGTWTSSAQAQIARAPGDSVSLIGQEYIGAQVRGTSSAFDPVNNVRLVVGSHDGLAGIFVNADGLPLSAPFQIYSAATIGNGQSVTVTYSPDLTDSSKTYAGGFLVTWQANLQTAPHPNYVFGRVISYRQAGYFVGGQFVISDSESWHEINTPPAVAYSPNSRSFLVAWRASALGRQVRGRFLSLDTLSLGTPFAISGPNAESLSLAYNPTSQVFGVAYTNHGTCLPGSAVLCTASNFAVVTNQVRLIRFGGRFSYAA
jgi:hypothetical protein